MMGKVNLCWLDGAYGKVTKIVHNGRYVSLYAHQNRIKVKPGDFIKRGDVIGTVGNTGRSTGPHLHLGLYKNGKAINPFRVITNSKVKRKVTLVKTIETKKVPIKGAKYLKKRLLKLISNEKKIVYRWEPIRENFVFIDGRKKDKYVKQ